jgi:hypothetical protein
LGRYEHARAFRERARAARHKKSTSPPQLFILVFVTHMHTTALKYY